MTLIQRVQDHPWRDAHLEETSPTKNIVGKLCSSHLRRRHLTEDESK